MAVKAYDVDFSEISASNENHARAWQEGMNFARLEFDTPKLKSYFMEWATANNLDGLEHFASLPDWRYATMGRAAWMMNNGAEMPAGTAEFFLNELQVLRSKQPEVAAIREETEERSLTADAKRVIQYVNLYSYIDAVRTKYATDEDTLEELIRKRITATAPAMSMLRKLYQHYNEYLKDALNNRDNQLVAATVEPLVVVVNVLASITGNATAMNASKKKVSIKTAKAVSKAKVKNLDTDTNMVGMSPALIVGSSAALLFNTKNRKAIFYVAKAGEELSVKGTYITGYDEDLSFGKTVRKPKETFAKMLHNTSSKRINEVLGTYIKGKRHAANGKLNKETMIVKVFK